MTFLLYGANGYTGELIARRAKELGLTPVLAGRNETKVKALADELGFAWEVFELTETEKLDSVLKKFSLVLHAAGPFAHTARPMMEACLRTGTHYLDITGEMSVFGMAQGLNAKAVKAGVMLMPGVGFDVVPTDCLALYLKERLPQASELKLAFATLGSGPSRGTAKTMVENLGELGAVRKDGQIKRVPLGHKTLRFPAAGKSIFAMTIPWGDVFTAFYTTGIPNVEVYMGVPPSTYRQAKLSWYLGWLLRSEWVKNIARRKIELGPPGPSDEQRASTRSHIWGEVKAENGVSLQATLTTPEGYTLTAGTSLIIAQKVVSGNFKPGFQTPAAVYGSGLIIEVDGVERRDI